MILFGDFKETAGKQVPADVPLNEFSGKHIAELVTSGNRPCVVGFRGWTQGNMHKFWIDFASTIFNSNEGELYLVIDEVHNFAPKGKIMSPEVGMCLHWANRIMNEGRGIGLVNLIASQRPQKVHNDTLTACETLVAMRVIHKADRDAVEDWIKGCGDEKQGKEVLNSLAGMKRGEAYVWSPEVDFGPERLTFPMFETFDSFAPPQLQKKVSGKDWASVNLDEVRTKLAAVIEKAKQTDPEELQKTVADGKKRIAELERKLTQAGAAKPAPAVETIKTVDKPVLKDGQLVRAEKILSSVGVLTDKLSNVATEIRDAIAKVNANGHKPGPVPRAVQVPPQRQPPPPVTRRPTTPTGAQPDSSLNKGELTILRAAVQFGSVTSEQLAVLTGYKSTSRYEYLRSLVAKGMVRRDGDNVEPTAEGIVAAGDVEQPPVGAELVDWWKARLSGGEAKIFEVVTDAAGDALSKEAIEERTGYKSTSIYEYTRKLAARKLVVTDRGGTRAADFLLQ